MEMTIGLLAALLGVSARFWVNRRRFYRRGIAGLDEHPSYLSAILVRFFERIVLVTSFVVMMGGFGYFMVGATKPSPPSGPDVAAQTTGGTHH